MLNRSLSLLAGARWPVTAAAGLIAILIGIRVFAMDDSTGVTPGMTGRQVVKEKHMMERTGLITTKGNPLTLVGDEVKVGDKAPDFTVIDNGMQPVKFSSFAGKVVIISVVPSLDTPVCDAQTRRFNTEAGKLGSDVVILTISMDLPFAQKRWCGAAGVDKVQTLSDYREASFGKAYGMLIKELRLLARGVFVVDRNGVVRYTQLVKEVSEEPDYAPVLDAVKKLM
jgi:thiol peroxidase